MSKIVKKTPYFFNANIDNRIKDSLVSILFPKNTFYEDLYFDYSFVDGVAILHDRSVPVHNYFRVSFDLSKYPREEILKMYIARKNGYGKLSYVGSKHKDDEIYASSKTLGEFTLSIDKTKPKIYHYNFKANQSLNKKRYLRVRISDIESGIKSYRGEIDGHWVLMEYNPKLRLLSYDFEDNKLSGTDHILKVIVTDNVNNSATFTTSFSRKN